MQMGSNDEKANLVWFLALENDLMGEIGNLKGNRQRSNTTWSVPCWIRYKEGEPKQDLGEGGWVFQK